MATPKQRVSSLKSNPLPKVGKPAKKPSLDPMNPYAKQNKALQDEINRRMKGKPSKGYGYGKNVE